MLCWSGQNAKTWKHWFSTAKGKCKPFLHVCGCRWYDPRLRYYTCVKKKNNRDVSRLFLRLWYALKSGIQYSGYWMFLADQQRKSELWEVLVKHAGWWVIEEQGILASKRGKKLWSNVEGVTPHIKLLENKQHLLNYLPMKYLSKKSLSCAWTLK